MIIPATLSIQVPDPIPGPAGPTGPQGPQGIPGTSFAPWLRWYTDPMGFYSAPLKTFTQWCPAVSKPTGGALVTIIPPLSGVGYLAIETEFLGDFENQSDVDAKVYYGIGTTDSVPGGKPLYPYLGVTHDRADINPPGSYYGWISVPARRSVPFYNKRWDIVDQALEADQPIPGWPNWSITQTPPPALVPCAGLDIAGAVVVTKCVQFLSKRVG